MAMSAESGSKLPSTQMMCSVCGQVKINSNHSCITALQTNLSIVLMKSSSLEEELKKQTTRFYHREAELLQNISCLYQQYRIQTEKLEKLLTVPTVYLLQLSLENQTDEIPLNVSWKSLNTAIISANNPLNHNIISQANPPFRSADIIVKVNGVDVTGLSEDKAAEVFREAKEPIIVKVIRRKDAAKQNDLSTPTEEEKIQYVDSSTQTDSQPADEKKQTRNIDIISCSSFTDLNDFDDCSVINGDEDDDEILPLPPPFDIEYHEVTLKRQKADDLYGLTLCEGTGEDSTGIYVSQIADNSLAKHSCEVNIGDQIVQVNGENIERSEQVFEKMNSSDACKLLVARPKYHLNDFFIVNEGAEIDDTPTIKASQSTPDTLNQCANENRPLKSRQLENVVDSSGYGSSHSPRIVKPLSMECRIMEARSIRDRILRERARQVTEERLTTDDEQLSEAKLGRYWTKGERKRHLIVARENRRRRQFMQQCRLKLQTLSETDDSQSVSKPDCSKSTSSSSTRMEKKRLRERKEKIWDNFLTIQQLLEKCENSGDGSLHPLLSVATV